MHCWAVLSIFCRSSYWVVFRVQSSVFKKEESKSQLSIGAELTSLLVLSQTSTRRNESMSILIIMSMKKLYICTGCESTGGVQGCAAEGAESVFLQKKLRRKTPAILRKRFSMFLEKNPECCFANLSTFWHQHKVLRQRNKFLCKESSGLVQSVLLSLSSSAMNPCQSSSR